MTVTHDETSAKPPKATGNGEQEVHKVTGNLRRDLDEER